MATASSLTRRRTFFGGIALASAVTLGGIAGFTFIASPVGAQQAELDRADFIDPVTGEFDLEAYLAALAGLQQRGEDGTGAAAPVAATGALPFTGSSTSDLVAGGIAVIVTGGAAVAITSKRRRRDGEAQTQIPVA